MDVTVETCKFQVILTIGSFIYAVVMYGLAILLYAGSKNDTVKDTSSEAAGVALGSSSMYIICSYLQYVTYYIP